MNSTVDAPAGEAPAPRVIPPHTLVPCVTLDSLKLNHASLTRLLDDVSKRIRDMLAAQYGVSVGSRVEYHPPNTGKRRRITVKSMSVAFERVPQDAKKPGDVRLIVRGLTTTLASTEYSFHWDPATCAVVGKGR